MRFVLKNYEQKKFSQFMRSQNNCKKMLTIYVSQRLFKFSCSSLSIEDLNGKYISVVMKSSLKISTASIHFIKSFTIKINFKTNTKF